MLDDPIVTVMCDGEELSSWRFEFPQNAMREDICVELKGNCYPVFVVKETIGPAIINVRGIAQQEARVSGDVSDHRRDDNLREVFG